MIEMINSYHIDYWIRNKIIDCSQVLANNILLPEQINRTHEEKQEQSENYEEEQYYPEEQELEINDLLSEKEHIIESHNISKRIIFKENNKKMYQLKYSKNKINLDNISRIYMNLLPKKNNKIKIYPTMSNYHLFCYIKINNKN
jgi:hypothetical protein